MADSIRRRRRPAVSCTLCRRRKIRCNRQVPCSNCIKSGSEPCVYGPVPVPPTRAARTTIAEPSSSAAGGHGTSAVPLAASGPDSGLVTEFWKEAASGLQTLHTMLSPATTMTASSTRPSVHTVPTGRQPSSSTSSVHPSFTTQSQSGGSAAVPRSGAAARQQVADESALRLAGHFHVVSDTNAAHNDNCHPYSSQSRHPFTRDGKTVIPRLITHKQRTFGQSHWISASLLFWDLIELMKPHLQASQSNVATPGFWRCKTLSKLIKARRAPSWPTPPDPKLPSRETCDALVNCYMRTSERLYRVLHIPSFERDFASLWTCTHDPATGQYLPSRPPSEKDMVFLIQVKLVLALGAVTYDKTFTLRPLATRYIYEARTWISEPEVKARLSSLQSVQNETLLLLAEEQVDVAGDAAWIGVGALLRRAIQLGAHRDPSHLPRAGLLATEMRRRLWNTILELNMQFAMSGGVPPGLVLDDFDTLPPGNYDDKDLVCGEGPAELPPKPEGVWTQTSLAIAMRRTLPARLETARAMNNIKSSHETYEQMLKLDGKLRVAYRELCVALQGFRNNGRASGSSGGQTGEAGKAPGSFELHAVDILMQRYLCFLHIPYIQASLQEKAYAYSRKVALESAVKVWYLVYPPPPTTTRARMSSSSSRLGPARPGSGQANLPRSSGAEVEEAEEEEEEEEEDDLLARFTINGSGYFRTTVAKVPIIIAKELWMQRAEEADTSFLLPLRPDLLAILDASRRWHRATLESGETEMKGYLLAVGVVRYIEFMGSGGYSDLNEELVKVLLQAIGESIEDSLPLLEAEAERYEAPVGEGEENVEGDGPRVDGLKDGHGGEVTGTNSADGAAMQDAFTGNAGPASWDTLMSNLSFDAMADADPMSWIISDDVASQEWLW